MNFVMNMSPGKTTLTMPFYLLGRLTWGYVFRKFTATKFATVKAVHSIYPNSHLYPWKRRVWVRGIKKISLVLTLETTSVASCLCSSLNRSFSYKLSLHTKNTEQLTRHRVIGRRMDAADTSSSSVKFDTLGLTMKFFKTL